MRILENNQRKDIRFKKGDFVLYEPSELQREEIFKIIEKQNLKIEGDNIEGELDTKFLRYILKECSSLGSEIDQYDDQELDIKFSNGNRDMTLFLREIERLTEELVEDLFYIQEKEIKLMIKMLDVLNSNMTKNEMEKKFNNLMKRNKVNVTLNDFIENKDNPEKLKELIKNSKKKNTSKKK